MKKIRLIIVAIISLVATLVVSSFAWFAINGNNGILRPTVNTSNQIIIDFNASGVDESAAMMPAKLKEGVINGGANGAIKGEGTSKEDVYVPTGRDVLPAHDANYKYLLENSSLIPKNKYLYTPATIIYSQFSVLLKSPTENLTSDLTLQFEVHYYTVDQILEGNNKAPITSLPIFEQSDALAFNFFLIESGNQLTQDELELISTNVGEDSECRMIEDYYFNKSSNFVFKNHGQGKQDDSNPLKNYRYESSKNGNSYSVTFKNLTVGNTYYIVLETYYSYPDAIIDGNLPLTGQFVLDLHYSVPEE